MNRKVINFLAFQAGWFACVLGAANGMTWLGVAVVSMVVALHLAMAAQPRLEVRLILLAIVLGFVGDSLLAGSGWLSYAGGSIVSGSAPYWILAMWALFATTLNLSMSWLKDRLVLASVMGAVFGPLSYFAGQRLGAIEIINSSSSIIALAVMWALAMPLLVFAASRFDGIHRAEWLVPLQTISKEE